MRNIQPYQGDALVLYEEILASKREHVELLERLKPRIRARYEAYERSKANLERFEPDDALTRERERTALVHCYDVETEPLRWMKRAVLDSLPREANMCPYCGIGEAMDGWDHYLPKRDFPDLSVHPTNLVPCCGNCNRHKGDRWKEGAQRTFIHFYFDLVDQTVPLLDASIEIAPDAEPKVTFRFTDRPYTQFFSLFKRHCRALNLLSRFVPKAHSWVPRIRREVLGMAGRLSEEAIAESLDERAVELARDLGINHWEPTLYRAAARSRDFLEYCLLDTAPNGHDTESVGVRQS